MAGPDNDCFNSLGKDFDPDIQLTVKAQVDKLILQSTSVEHLCQLFSGWYVKYAEVHPLVLTTLFLPTGVLSGSASIYPLRWTLGCIHSAAVL